MESHVDLLKAFLYIFLSIPTVLLGLMQRRLLRTTFFAVLSKREWSTQHYPKTGPDKKYFREEDSKLAINHEMIINRINYPKLIEMVLLSNHNKKKFEKALIRWLFN